MEHKDEVLPQPKLCPEFPAAVTQNISGLPQLKGGISCIGLMCAKYQVCQVLPETQRKIQENLATLIDLLAERQP